MDYTVQKLAKLAGLSTRTLRYYDKIGLLKPERINSSGYRIYTGAQVDRLQHILFYRELGLKLDVIKDMMFSENFDRQSALEEHLSYLYCEKNRIDTLINNVENTLNSIKIGVTIDDTQKFEGFKKRIQIAIDYNLTIDDALHLIDETIGTVEVFELGTPFLRTQGGLKCIKIIRRKYPELIIYADTKITDGGSLANIEGTAYEAAKNSILAGANIITVMATSSNDTIKDVIRAGHDFGAEVLADLMDIDDVVKRATELDAMGVDYVSANTLYVNRPAEELPSYYKPLADLKLITPHLKHSKPSIQGGVTLENIREIAKLNPSLICIGRGIYKADDPKTAARTFRQIVDKQ